LSRVRANIDFWVRLLLTAILAVVFFLSASFKVANPDKIPDVLAKLPLLPELGEVARSAIAGALLGLEAFIAIALVFRFSVRIALQAVIAVSLLFAIVVAPFYEQLGGDCGCLWRWVPFAPESGLQLILRNIGLAAMAAWLLRRTRTSATGPVWNETRSSSTQRSS
jgi:hypothetical protein